MIAALSAALFSCGDGAQEERRASDPSPLEIVRRLADENSRLTGVRPETDVPAPPEFKALHDRGQIVFAMVAGDQKPFFYTDEQTGELIGLDVEIGYAAANQLKLKAVFNRDAANFDEVVMKVAKGEADVALSKLSVTARRAETVRFTNPYIVFRQALLVNRLEFAKIGPERHLPRFIRNYRGSIGVLNNTSYVNFAMDNFPGASILRFDTWAEAENALFSGGVLAIYRDEGQILITNASRKDASILVKPVFISDKLDPIAMAVSADAPLLQSWLNVFLDDYISRHRKELIPSRLIERHFGTGS